MTMTNDDMHAFRPSGQPPTLHNIICEGMGYASVCWTNLEGAGVFQSEAAVSAAHSTIDRVRTHLHSELVKLLDVEGVAVDWNRAIEAALSVVEHTE